VVCPTPLPYRYVRRGRRGSTHNEVGHTSRIDLSVIVITVTEDNNLARKLNYYLESNKDKVLVNGKDIANIPFQDILFTNRIDADALPMPLRKASQRTQKSTRDAVCWHINESGVRSQWTIEKLNSSVYPVVFVDDITPESKALAEFIPVFNIPKCNKDLVLKKGMTLEQGKKYLLSKNKQDALGLSSLPNSWEKINVLKKFNRRKTSASLQVYLLKEFPDLKDEVKNIESKYEKLLKKYPLIKALDSISYHHSNSIQIVVDEINKQSKEDV
jgi:hypothetical protein